MSEFNEPWTLKDVFEFSIVNDSNGSLVADDEGLFDPEYASRIVACVNFCRQFPTEWLTDRELIKLTGTPSDENVFRMFSAVGLYPTKGRLPSE